MIDIAHRSEQIPRPIVTAAQMQAIETRSFDAGIPVPALMEKVAGKLVQRFLAVMQPDAGDRVGILVGPGHNGGDALVMARELWLAGYDVAWYAPLAKAKPLTESHQHYAQHLGIPQVHSVAELVDCAVVIDGLFGFGLDRPIAGELAQVIDTLNASPCPVFSIDLPSGLHTDSGEVLGTALRATHTVCLGLWKRAFVQEAALDWVGTTELLDFGLPWADVVAELGDRPPVQRLTPKVLQAGLPLPRPRASHKYQNGHLLIVAGSQQYRGAVILAGLAARASGVGMVTLAVPESISTSVAQALPEALVLACDETASGAIAQLPPDLDLARYDAIAIGPGLTPAPVDVVQQVLAQTTPVLVDADGLNILAQNDPIAQLQAREALTVLTPHWGECRRLFPELVATIGDRLDLAAKISQQTHSTLVLKGACTAIAATDQPTWVNPTSTPALARGGSGDVLTGLMGGLLAQAQAQQRDLHAAVLTAVGWHAQAAVRLEAARSPLGVDAFTLANSLCPPDFS